MQPQQTRAERIRLVRTTNNLSQEAFAARLSSPRRTITRGAIGNWELGRGIKGDNLALIAERFGVSLDWLSNGKGQAPTAQPHHRVPAGEEFTDSASEQAAVFEGGQAHVPAGEIPQVAARLGLGHSEDVQTITIPAGHDSIAAVPVVDTWKVPLSVLQRRLRGSIRSVHIIECEGDSMEPRIHDGDFVFIDTSRRTPSPPGIFALNDGFGQTLKRLEIVPNSDPPRVKIIPENSRHDSYERGLDEIAIIGRYLCRLTMD
ncbi:MAG: XRE family transcriptional regulator [Pseudolabrys sp.]